jgi:hypothetical protein
LQHGGADNDNWKPHHLSIMNYLYQMRGVLVNGRRRLVFSSQVCEALDETRLSESNGVSCHPTTLPHNKQTSEIGADLFLQGTHRVVRVNEPVDWNGDGHIGRTPVQRDLNFDTKKTVLGTVPDEYALLKLDGLQAQTPFKEADVGSGRRLAKTNEWQMVPGFPSKDDPLSEPSFDVFSTLVLVDQSFEVTVTPFAEVVRSKTEMALSNHPNEASRGRATRERATRERATHERATRERATHERATHERANELSRDSAKQKLSSRLALPRLRRVKNDSKASCHTEAQS